MSRPPGAGAATGKKSAAAAHPGRSAGIDCVPLCRLLSRVWKSGSGALDITVTFTFPIPREAMPHAYQLSPLIAVCFARVLRERFGVDGACSSCIAL